MPESGAAAVKNAEFNRIKHNWPQKTSDELKKKIVWLFREETCSDVLWEATCACCSESVLESTSEVVSADSINLTILRRPDQIEVTLQNNDDGCVIPNNDDEHDGEEEVQGKESTPYLDPDCIPPEFPYVEGPLKDVLLDTNGVSGDGQDILLWLQILRNSHLISS